MSPLARGARRRLVAMLRKSLDPIEHVVTVAAAIFIGGHLVLASTLDRLA
jgi:hypothetical protein